MKKNKLKLKIVIIMILLTFSVLVFTACDCKSKEQVNSNVYSVNVIVDDEIFRVYHLSEENKYSVILPYNKGDIVSIEGGIKCFYGWFEDEEYEKEISTVCVIKENTNVYGKWSVTEYQDFIVKEENQKFVITGYSDTEDEIVVVPEYINGKLVNKVEVGAFSNVVNLERILFCGAIESIGDNAFSGCVALKEINFLMNKPVVTTTALPNHLVYDITYNLDGGEVLGNPKTYSQYSESFKLINPTKSGYKFLGWSGTGINDVQEEVVIESNSTGNREYSANWEQTLFNITYDYGEDSIILENPTTYDKYGQTLTLINPERQGYEFCGWIDENGEQKKEITIETGSVGDKHYSAVWKLVEYNISYELGEGGINNTDNLSKYTIETPTITLLSPSRQHYDFIKWTVGDEECTSIEIGSMGDIVITAVWSPVEYNVKYILDGGTNADNNPTVRTIESEQQLLYAPEKTAYLFVGWSVGNEIITKLSSGGCDITLTAVWETRTYSINYYLDGGRLDDKVKSYTVESSDVLITKPERDFYEFVGWSETLNGEIRAQAKIPSGSYGNKDFYAHWKPINYNIEYDLCGGNNFSDALENYTVESEDIILGKPNKDGYKFIEWTDENEQPIDKIPKGSNGNKKINAKWELENYNIIYQGLEYSDFDGEYPKTFNIQSSTIELIIPNRKGYDFVEWQRDGKQVSSIPSGSFGDITLTAVWQAVFEYSENTVTDLTDYGKLLTEVVVPDTIDGSKITRLHGCFYANETTRKVIIENGIEVIGKSSFYDCKNLQTVEFEEGSALTTIEAFAFLGCDNLKSITIPENITLIEQLVFEQTVEEIKFSESGNWKLIFDDGTSLTEQRLTVNDTDNYVSYFKGEYIGYKWIKAK